MVGDHPQGHVGAVVRTVLLLGQLGRPVEDLPGGVDLIEVVDALQDGGHPFQAHAGVHVLERQRALDVEVVLGPDRAEHVLHEDAVPDLQEAVLVRFRAAVAAVFRAAVVVDLRAGTARPRHAHVPVVVLEPAELDAALRQADHVPPDAEGLGVVGQHGRPEPVLGEPEPAVSLRPGQQFPRPRDHLLLEVVAERPVAEHLEEGGMPGGLADLFDVQRAQALLHVGYPLPRGRLLAEEVGLEGLHPGDDEHQRGVFGDQAGRGHDRVPLLLEKGQETADDLCRLHQRPSFSSSWWWAAGRGGAPGAPPAGSPRRP